MSGVSTPYGNFRIGDQERMDAMDALGRALGEGRLYSGREIMQARRSGKRMRAGVFWLGTVGALGLTALHPVFLLIIPTLFILLYVMKVGPDSWYTPSLRQLEQQRRQEIKRRQLEIESAKAHQQAMMRVQRKDQFNQLTSDALDVAQNTINRFRKP